MNKGKVDALIVVGLNPAFVAPSGLNFKSCLSKVDTVIYTGDRLDETGEAADFLVPTSHFLESWDITNPKKWSIWVYTTYDKSTIQNKTVARITVDLVWRQLHL
jgi:anaerobic selenocysteine-containing dehydrogenase